MSVTLKLAIENEIRRLTIPEKELNMPFLIEKCQKMFGEKLTNKRFTFSYLDNEGDKITFDTQEELSQLLLERRNNPRNLFLNIEVHEGNPKHFGDRKYCPFNFLHLGASQNVTEGNQSAQKVIHTGVICDVCQAPICGRRFKCTVCSDFDICETCEKKESLQEITCHSQERHLYLMIEKPVCLKQCPLGISLPTFKPSDSCRTTPISTVSNHKSWLGELFEEESQNEKDSLSVVVCDNCGKQIENQRYKCCLCEDFDLCSACVDLPVRETKHPQDHCVWLQVVPLSFDKGARMRAISSVFSHSPLMIRFGPFMIPTKVAEQFLLGMAEIEKSVFGSPIFSQTLNPLPFHFFSACQPSQGPQQAKESPKPQHPSGFEMPREFHRPFSQAPQEGVRCADSWGCAQPEVQQPGNKATGHKGNSDEKTQGKEEVLDEEMLRKLQKLEEMGFTDRQTNISLLKQFGGRIDRLLDQLFFS